MKTFSLLLFSLIFAASCFGREIKGRIIDFEKNPIADASVIFSEGIPSSVSLILTMPETYYFHVRMSHLFQ